MAPKVVCVDASFIVRLITSNTPDSAFDQYWEEWQEAKYTITAPTLLFYEVSNALYRYAQAGQLTAQEVSELLAAALGLGLWFYGDAQLHQQALAIAQRENLSATYDAHYLALAERLDAPFWTADRRLFQAVQPQLRWVHFVS